ncbi:MAG: hypothetical protein ACT4OK_10175 [Gemmobacter sp.]
MARRPADDEDDDDDDDDKQYVVTGDELKKLVRLGRKRPMPFAFCPSSGDDDSLFATHRKKPAKKIAKATKADSGQLKVAWGTFVIVDRVMVLTCDRELPSIAKKLKKHMRAERLPLNIRVLDATGREIESDIEDLTGEDDPFADLGDEDEDGDHLVKRLRRLADAVMAARGQEGDRLRDLMGSALRATEAGSRDKAQKLVALVERDVRRLMGSASRPAGVTLPDLPPPDDEDVDDEVEVEEDEALEPARATAAERLPLARRLNALRDRAQGTGGTAAERLMQALGLAARTLRDGDAQGATEAMDRIEAAIDRVEARSSV